MLTDSLPPSNFWLVIAVQFFWFAIVFLKERPSRSFLNCLSMGFLLGIPYGAAMDLLVGDHNTVFNYFGYENSWAFLLFNWLLSYGLAISTVLATGKIVLPKCRPSFTYVALLLAAAITLELIYQTSAIGGTLIRMIVLGAILLLLSEVLVSLLGRAGFLLGLFQGKVTFGRFWLFAFMTGLVYESANIVSPLWDWENEFPSSNENVVLVICFGYCALLYPIVAIKALLEMAEKNWHKKGA